MDQKGGDTMVDRNSNGVEIICVEGHSIFFNLVEFINRWKCDFMKLGLKHMSEALKTNMKLSDEGLAKMEKWTKLGYNFAFLFPPNPWQYLADIVLATEKPLRGLLLDQQYNQPIGIHFQDEAQNNFPQGIKTLRRPENTPYILLVKLQKEVDPKTIGKNPKVLSKRLAQEGKSGVTVYEYCLIQRMLTSLFKDQKNPHPNSKYYTYLLDSDIAGLWAVCARWYDNLRFVGIGVATFDYPLHDYGAMSAIVIPLQ